jgi:hypothetical protein
MRADARSIVAEPGRFLAELESSGDAARPAFRLASALALQGEIDAAFAWLEHFKGTFYE